MVPSQHEPGAAGDELFDPGTVTVAHPAPGLAVVSLRGEHDLSTQPTLAKALDAAGERIPACSSTSPTAPSWTPQ